MNKMTDEQLAKKLKKHNESALEKIMKKYTPLLSAIVYNISKGGLTTSDIEEVVADSFLNLWNNADKVRPESLKGYLCCIAKNNAKNKIRANKHPNIISIDDLISEAEDTFEISKETEDKMIGDILYDAVNSMGEPDREIVLRHYYYYQPSSKISEIMDINVTALFCISDNTVLNKSVFSGRTEEEHKYRHEVRFEVIPRIIVDLFERIKK
jgi:RNA polymerase sigma-70 factor (ECF subfamily)